VTSSGAIWARLARACHHGGVSSGIQEWFAGRIPSHWNATGLDVVADQDEILVLVDLATDAGGLRHFRESTRDERMALALAAEQRFGRKVSWGARTGDVVVVFTTASVPMMTRLRLPERRVLDTLIDAGVARSRSDALAWCVRLVGENETEWIAELRTAFEKVEATRARGPRARRDKDTTTEEPGCASDAAG
jgi:Arc/MetJ-type ribon-helix-helix transcriptional regulator